MVELKVTKEFLDRYRQYKLDLIDNVAEKDFCYDALRYLLDSNKNTLSNIYDQLGNYDWIKINVISGEITKTGKILVKSTKPTLSDWDDDFSF